MRLVLKSYSQDVDLLDATKATYMLAFEDEHSGHEIRLPVPQETVETLVGKLIILNSGPENTTAPTPKQPEPEEDFDPSLLDPEDEEVEGADVFGEEQEDLGEEEQGEWQEDAEEDGVPSL